MTPPDSTSRLQRAQQYLDLGELDDALAEAYSLVTIDPHNLDGWWFIAQHSAYAGPKREALRRVLAINPHFHPAHAIAIQMGVLESPPENMPTVQTNVPSLPEAGGSPLTPPSSVLPIVEGTPPPVLPTVNATPPPVQGAPAQYPPSYPPSYPSQAQGGYPPAYPAAYPPPQGYPSEPVPPPRHYEPIQPFLILNGGCSSGCFAGTLTFFVMAALLLFLVWGSINTALHNTKMLDQSQSISADLIPAVAMTGLLSFLRANAGGLPFNLDVTLANAGINLPTTDDLYSAALRDLWTSLDYPDNTADAIMQEVGYVWPRLTAAPWVPLVVFFCGWLIFAFLFVFLRARSRRFLHWGLSTVGLWLLAAVGTGIALLVFTFVYGGA